MPLTDLVPAAAAHPLLRDRRRLARYLLLGAGAAAAGYGAYRLYHSEAAADGRRQLAHLRAALAAYADAFGTGADTLQLLLADLRGFLQSDRADVPPSLRQLARLMQSQEVADSTSATVAALLRGVPSAGAGSSAPAAAAVDGDRHGTNHGSNHGGGSRGGGALDRVLEALLSERGQGLVSVAVSLGARNLVAAYCEAQHTLAAQDAAAAAAAHAPPPPDLAARLLGFLASPAGQQLAVLTIGAFVSSGMRAYLDQTLDLNLYEVRLAGLLGAPSRAAGGGGACYWDLFAAMAKPEHLEAVKQCVGVFARDVVGTYLAGPAAIQAGSGQDAAAAAAAAAQPPPPPRAQLRLSTSIHKVLGGAGVERERRPREEEEEAAAAADTGSPCGSSASGEWSGRRCQAAAVPAPAAPSDIDSDVLLPPEAAPAKGGGGGGGGGDSARSHDSAASCCCTPPAAAETAAAAAGAAARPVLPQLRRVQQQEAAAGLQRQGSGNLEWISAVGKEWLNVAQHPHGRTVMVELAGTAAKEAARGMGAALADQFHTQWLVLAAFAVLLLALLMQRMLATVLL
ncbi:hypothetical protein CHLNCDRAFT_144726 [Chlorella variabilis]|uniref:Protein PHLOEM PROTEIN 2-LIKE A10 n=1 Tax=Chlorella variabilis TaxID=554065 RepID=E1ZCW2_CHLVA|nr:hypothetical protein CHLNCDRAFT_144726 [Chlorella variabilis]EFN56310.1 hypothetical protein CHLNCDRAFT_144726 [Chlorella variabilis]|eukprot:XP_005848412.1 hypothetical protein CHLNCDRAFT_144726 [Chlorella variabilis]